MLITSFDREFHSYALNCCCILTPLGVSKLVPCIAYEPAISRIKGEWPFATTCNTWNVYSGLITSAASHLSETFNCKHACVPSKRRSHSTSLQSIIANYSTK